MARKVPWRVYNVQAPISKKVECARERADWFPVAGVIENGAPLRKNIRQIFGFGVLWISRCEQGLTGLTDQKGAIFEGLGIASVIPVTVGKTNIINVIWG